MKLEKLEDVLGIDTEALKVKDAKSVLKRIKQIIKDSGKKEQLTEIKAENMPYEAVSIVGNKYVTIKFDLDSKQGLVTDEQVDTRDIRDNSMARYFAENRLFELGQKQKEVKDEK